MFTAASQLSSELWEGTILVFLSGKAEINAFIDNLTNLQDRGFFTANLYPYAFHADLSYRDKDMLTQYPIRDVDRNQNPTLRNRLLQNAAQNESWGNEGRLQRTAEKPNYMNWAQRTVIVAKRQESHLRTVCLWWTHVWSM